MKLSDLESFIRLIVPSANTKKVNQTKLRLLINKGVRNVNVLGKVLTKSGNFKALDGVSEYIITEQSELSDFVLIGESGVWHNRGSVDDPFLRELEGADRSYLNERFPNWYVQASGTPLYAVVEPNLITIHAKPSADLDDGFFLPDYVYKPTDMSNGDQYPFSGTTTEFTQLEVLDDAIIDYVRWMLGLSVGKDQQGIVTRKEYEATVTTTTRLLKRRPDFKSNRDNVMSGHRRKN